MTPIWIDAFAVDWDGNVEASGSITSGDTCYVTHGKANADAMTNTTRTDTGRSVAFGVGAGGSISFGGTFILA